MLLKLLEVSEVDAGDEPQGSHLFSLGEKRNEEKRLFGEIFAIRLENQ